MSTRKHTLAITILGEHFELVHDLTQLFIACNCNIINLTSKTFIDTTALCIHIDGTWHAIAKIETQLTLFADKQSLEILTKRTSGEDPRITPPTTKINTITYNINVTTPDKTGLVHKLTQFFNKQNILIDTLNVQAYANYVKTKVVTIDLSIKISLDTHIPSLRDKFTAYCDSLNLDASMEPARD